MQLRRRCPIHAAADIIHGGAGREIAWTEPVGRKASHHAWAAEEAVGQRHLLSAPTGGVAALATDHPNQVVAERLIVARVLAGPEEFHVATKTREILPELRIDAVGRALGVIERGVGDGIADGRDPLRSGRRRLPDRQ